MDQLTDIFSHFADSGSMQLCLKAHQRLQTDLLRYRDPDPVVVDFYRLKKKHPSGSTVSVQLLYIIPFETANTKRDSYAEIRAYNNGLVPIMQTID